MGRLQKFEVTLTQAPSSGRGISAFSQERILDRIIQIVANLGFRNLPGQTRPLPNE
jgi:hypothetical protein